MDFLKLMTEEERLTLSRLPDDDMVAQILRKMVARIVVLAEHDPELIKLSAQMAARVQVLRPGRSTSALEKQIQAICDRQRG